MRSISQIARELGYSHTAISNAITKLEAEHGRTIGQASTNGKARMISNEDFELIKARCPKKMPKHLALTVQPPIAASGFVVPQNSSDIRESIEAELVDEREKSVHQLQAFNSMVSSAKQAIQNLESAEDAELFADLERYKQKLLTVRQVKEQMKAEILYGKVGG